MFIFLYIIQKKFLISNKGEKNMDWLSLLYDILDRCLIPLLGILTIYIVKFINIKSCEIQNKVNNDTADKYITMVADTITACVIATN
jgi:hypothetical protein